MNVSEDTTKPDLSSLRIRRDDGPAPGAVPPHSGVALWKWVVPLVLLGAVAVFFVARGGARAIEVETATVQRLSPGSAQSLLTATGYVVAQRRAAVASKGTGRLEILNVREGDRVRAGDIIGRLEANDVDAALGAARARVAQAEAELERARASAKEAQLIFDRTRELLANKLVAQADYDNAEARHHTALAGVNSAEAAIQSAKADAKWAEVQVENTCIRAPFDGTVLSKNAEVGEVVAPFASSVSSRGAVVTLADMSSLEVEADVSESNIERIQAGLPCLITLDAFPTEPYRGRVKKIVPTADRAKATVMTKIAFDNLDARVLPEMSAKVSFLPANTDSATLTTKTVLSVPTGALADRDGQQVVYVIREGQAHETPVAVGETYGGAVEIRSGLDADAVVVLHPPVNLRDGDHITLKP